jgi:phenylpropionate dioxygenase-like ring-hydroxylating dioxygenase large terminal subunit
MIKNQWYVIAESKEVKPGQKEGLRRIGKALVMWRNTEGVLLLMLDLRPQRGAALSTGGAMNNKINAHVSFGCVI